MIVSVSLCYYSTLRRCPRCGSLMNMEQLSRAPAMYKCHAVWLFERVRKIETMFDELGRKQNCCLGY